MAPPRQRTTAVQDDSRSEGSSTAKETKSTTAAKGRKGTAAASAAATAATHASKTSSHLPSVTSAPSTGDADHPNNQAQAKINWPDMPLDLLHSYRHSYKLACPSAFTSEYSHIILSKGIGLRSPTSIAAQRAHLAHPQPTPAAAAAAAAAAVNGLASPAPTPNGVRAARQHSPRSGGASASKSRLDGKSALNHIIGQDRVTKNQLALAVRKHFNGAGLAEQEAIARFLYKVREEGRGRQFRLRFQP
ncbi:hypothetical protein BDV59DRAFT_202021 [Aspergillus ambiguus]|uniref:histone deacetylase complex subunit SAP30 Sin3-binding domain-containing protein n=1 Tax=Aspergillus ambiguus TaxID=176160 RepID=UPI003CCCDD2B